jgi:hypothetical protein
MYSYIIQSHVSTDKACNARQAGISLNFSFVVHRLLECNIPMRMRAINFICKTTRVYDGFFLPLSKLTSLMRKFYILLTQCIQVQRRIFTINNHQRYKQPTKCNIFRLLIFLMIFLNQPYVFRARNSPIIKSTFDCIYSFWYNAQTLLPTGDTVEMELKFG